MRRIGRVSEIREMVDEVKASGGRLLTNFFPSDSALEPEIAAGAIFAERASQAALLVKREIDFDRFYFVSTSVEALGAALRSLPRAGDRPAVVDVVGVPGDIEPLVRQWENAGFPRYTEFIRMQRMGSSAPAEEDCAGVSHALPEEADEVLRVIATHFDCYAEHIPGVDELRGAAARNTILLCREDAELAALLYYDCAGVTTTLRYWLALPAYRGHGHAGKLIRRYLRDCNGAKRFLLWVERKNERAQELYRSYGYAAAPIVDVILKGKSWIKC